MPRTLSLSHALLRGQVLALSRDEYASNTLESLIISQMKAIATAV